MTIFENLKTGSIAERKRRGNLASYSTFVLAEIIKVAKNRTEPTDDECIRVLRKLQETARELNNTSEVVWLEAYLPAAVSSEDVRAFLNTLTDANRGTAMKALKEKFGASVDMKMAAALFTELNGS